MPLREDLLEPIAGENPSGPNLYYDKVFDQLKEARIEEDDSGPMGDWGRSAKKADRVLVIKVAGETLAKRSKDLRLAGWYLESLVRKEGFSELAPGLKLLAQLQEQFWETLHPERDEDGTADLRIGAVEAAVNLLATQIKQLPLTKSGTSFTEYNDAKALGYDADPRSDEKASIRQDAIARGRMTADELQTKVDATPKAFYAETETLLVAALEAISDLDRLHEEKYGDDYPSLGKLKSSIEDVKHVVSSILNEKRKTDPDPVELPPEEIVEETETAEGEAEGEPETGEDGLPIVTAKKARVPAGVPGGTEDAYAQVAACAEFLATKNPASPVPYLLCTALRLGETRSADLTNYSFPVAPATEVRQAMRKLAHESNWAALMKLCIKTLPEPCGRVWLDLQRYTWAAAQGSGNSALASIVVSTMRSLLTDLPDLRSMTLNDDTSAANPETQQWLDTEVLPKPAVEE
jgi:type VI secretion system protein ImpA